MRWGRTGQTGPGHWEMDGPLLRGCGGTRQGRTVRAGPPQARRSARRSLPAWRPVRRKLAGSARAQRAARGGLASGSSRGATSGRLPALRGCCRGARRRPAASAKVDLPAAPSDGPWAVAGRGGPLQLRVQPHCQGRFHRSREDKNTRDSETAHLDDPV